MLKVMLFIFLLLSSTIIQAKPNVQDENIFITNQTSASLLVSFAEKVKQDAEPSKREEADKKYLLVYDIYIKARSYAFLNKIFFWFSLVFGLTVLLWPSLSIIFKKKLTNWEWVKSATVQTTVTGIAALMFTFYTQYKDKQTNAETLMRHVIYSKAPVSSLSIKVSEELARIDRGFSFNSILGEENSIKTVKH